MLRALVLLLLVANLAYWAWSTGQFGTLGVAPPTQRDPGRAALQVRPDSVRVLPPGAASAAQAAASVAASGDRPVLACLEAGPFATADLDAAERALAAHLPAGGWLRLSREVAAQYAVVLGPFSARETQQKKSAELGRLHLGFEEVRLPGPNGPAPALALGRYDSRAAADASLASFNLRGVRTARVAALRNASSEVRLRVANATPAVATRLLAINAAALGAGFAPCPAPNAAP
jgi:hypothetical protein